MFITHDFLTINTDRIAGFKQSGSRINFFTEAATSYSDDFEHWNFKTEEEATKSYEKLCGNLGSMKF